MNIDAGCGVFVFAWDSYGIESIVSIDEYIAIDEENVLRKLRGEPVKNNPLGQILHGIKLRAQINSHRFYEIYSVKCDKSLDEKFWRRQWREDPQGTADLLRERGYKIFSNRRRDEDVIIR